jgi:Hypoxia induced protein conserved region
MNTFLLILIALTAIATVVALVRGLVVMAGGKDVSGQASNKFMFYRVAFQAVTVVLLVILAMAMGNIG